MNFELLPIINDKPADVSKQNNSISEIPTTDDEVKNGLRKLGAPITLFGEDKVDRRNRLVKLLEEKPHEVAGFEYSYDGDGDGNEEGSMKTGVDQQSSEMDEDDEEEEDFYTPGSQALYDLRKTILHKSLEKAAFRVGKQREAYYKQDFIKQLKHRRIVNKKLEKFELFGSQVIPHNARAISKVRFSGDSSLIACGTWDGLVSVIGADDLEAKFELTGGHHSEKVSAVDFQVSNKNLLASGGGEGNINFWSFDKEESDPKRLKPLYSIKEAHSFYRITNVLFHPFLDCLASTSFDQTWKLWDIHRPEEALLQQEGHSREVYSGSFHPDGSIFASGGLDAVARIWDLRSGRSIATLQSHIKGIYGMDWSPNGYNLATASGDCSVKIWDLRKLGNPRTPGEVFSIPSHTKIVSDVRFFRHRGTNSQRFHLGEPVTDEYGNNEEVLDVDGLFLATSSYDGTVNIWSADNWIKNKSLKGHNDKVMSCDISGDGNNIVSSGWDRTVKLWSLTN